MLSVGELHLLEPLDATAPLAERMFHELRRLGCKVAVEWVVRPPAAGDETIHGTYMREAGITGRTEAEIELPRAARRRRRERRRSRREPPRSRRKRRHGIAATPPRGSVVFDRGHCHSRVGDGRVGVASLMT